MVSTTFRPYVGGGATGVVTLTAAGRINIKRLDALLKDLPHRAEQIAHTHAQLVRYWAIQFAPEQEVNSLGFLQNDRGLTIKQGIVVQKIGPARYAILATAPQSAPQEFGAVAHDIPARTSAGLHFWWQRESQWRKTMSVRHPGNPPHPFMLPARRRVAATYFKALRGMFEENGIPWRVGQ